MMNKFYLYHFYMVINITLSGKNDDSPPVMENVMGLLANCKNELTAELKHPFKASSSYLDKI